MSDLAVPKIPKWPFLAGDLLLLGVAVLAVWQGGSPLGSGEMLLVAACVAFGAVLGVTPFVLEYRYYSKLAQVERLQQSLLQVHKIETIGRQITSATACWQAVQDDATKAVDAARQINESMTAEARAFQAFLEKANDTERQHLRLEVEKLHRSEGDWSRVLILVLDHVYALFQAAVRSGQPGLIEQLGAFQHACRDAASRVGLVAFEAKAGDRFDGQLHQWDQDSVEPPPNMVVGETLATGYRYQGRTIRRALVSMASERPEPSPLSISEINQHHEQSQQPSQPPSQQVEDDQAEGWATGEPAEPEGSDPWSGMSDPGESEADRR